MLSIRTASQTDECPLSFASLFYGDAVVAVEEENTAMVFNAKHAHFFSLLSASEKSRSRSFGITLTGAEGTGN